VLALAGVGLARLVATATVPRRATAVALGVVLVAVAVSAWPPATSPDGGWRLADAAATRVQAAVGDRTFALDGIPPFKSADALRFPLEHRGAAPLPADAVGTPAAQATVLVCDPLFDAVVGAPCGGPAEAAWASAKGVSLPVAQRFEAGPRRIVTVYAAP